MLHLEHSFVRRLNFYTSVSTSGIPGKFRNVVLEKDGEDRLDRSCEKLSLTKDQRGEEYSTVYQKKEGCLDWSHFG